MQGVFGDVPNLTRQQKKKLERETAKKNKSINLSVSQVQQMKKDITSEVSWTALILMLGIPLMVLRDKYGFGCIRLPRFIKQCIQLYDSFDKGYITLDDLHNTIKDETGINVTEAGTRFYFDDTEEE